MSRQNSSENKTKACVRTEYIKRKDFRPLLEKTKKKGADRTNCKCNFCIHQRCIPETRWEPAEYYCDEDSDNYGTDWGCYLFEDADDAANAAVADF